MISTANPAQFYESLVSQRMMLMLMMMRWWVLEAMMTIQPSLPNFVMCAPPRA